MAKQFVGLIDPNNAFEFVAGNVRAFYQMKQTLTDKESIACMGQQVGVTFTPEQIDSIYNMQTTASK